MRSCIDELLGERNACKGNHQEMRSSTTRRQVSWRFLDLRGQTTAGIPGAGKPLHLTLQRSWKRRRRLPSSKKSQPPSVTARKPQDAPNGRRRKQRHRKIKTHRQGLQAAQKVGSGHSTKAWTKKTLYSAKIHNFPGKEVSTNGIDAKSTESNSGAIIQPNP